MKEKKLTEEEIMTAAKCCIEGKCYSPNHCPLADKAGLDTDCKYILMKGMYDLISHKNSEIKWYRGVTKLQKKGEQK